MLFRWFWPLAWAWPLARSRPKKLLLKAQKLLLKAQKPLLTARWKLPKARPTPLLTPPLLVPTLLPLAPPKLPTPLATLLPLLATPPLLRRKKPRSKSCDFLSVWGRHPQGWRPFPFARGCASHKRMITGRLALLPALLLTSACGSDADAPGAGGMTLGENERLEAAAERLDARAQSPAQPAAAALEAEVAGKLAAEQQQQAAAP